MISALVVAKNEEVFIKGCLERLLPYVEEIIFVDNSSQDKTREIVENIKNPKIKIFDYPNTDNQSELRQFSLDQATQEWIWQVDADEWYEPEDCQKIVEAVKNAKDELSFRVSYHQLAWRYGYVQKDFVHYPDRLYKREAVDRYDGMLPNDMTKVKRGYYNYYPMLEYDQANNKSFENPRQPIIDAKFYHFARTRGYNYEFTKWARYLSIMHPNKAIEEIKSLARINQWVTGNYELEKINLPFEIPKANPKISVVITNYNYAEYVPMAIQSVLNQTYPAYELIVVDDFSTDNSVEVISQLPVSLIKMTHNAGVAEARNAGVLKSTGDLVLMLDADDEIEPNFIEKCVERMKGDTHIVYTDIHFIGDIDTIIFQGEPETMKEWQSVPSCCALIDRRVFDSVGGFYPDEWYEDWGFWLRCFDEGFNFVHINEPLFRYRKHGKSRIDFLDTKQEYGFQQLRERYKIKR